MPDTLQTRYTVHEHGKVSMQLGGDSDAPMVTVHIDRVLGHHVRIEVMRLVEDIARAIDREQAADTEPPARIGDPEVP